MDSLDTNPVPAQAGDCEVKLLEWPGSDYRDGSVVVSPDGAYAAAAVAGTGDFVLWHDGEAKLVTAMEGAAKITLDGVNSHGVVIGQDFDSMAEFAWDAGTGEPRELDGSWKVGVELAGINDDGTIVETEQKLDGEPFYGDEVRIWPEGAEQSEKLKLESTKNRAPKVTAISQEGMLAGGLFKGESVEMGGEYDFIPRLWRPDGTAVKIPVDEWDAYAIDLAGGWVIVAAESSRYRWKFTTDEKPVMLSGFNAVTVDESGRAYGANGAGDSGVPAVYDSEAYELPVPEAAEPAPQDPTQQPVPDTVTDASLDGSVLVGTWKGNPVRWTCDTA